MPWGLAKCQGIGARQRCSTRSKRNELSAAKRKSPDETQKYGATPRRPKARRRRHKAKGLRRKARGLGGKDRGLRRKARALRRKARALDVKLRNP